MKAARTVRRGGVGCSLEDATLPTLLNCLSKQAMQGAASANGVAPRNTGKETRAAMIAQVGQGRFVHPAALFPPTAKELQARRKPSSLVASEDEGLDGDPDGLKAGEEETEAPEHGHEDDEDVAGLDPENGEPGRSDVPPGVVQPAGRQAAA